MKKATVLALVLFVVFSSHLFSETLDCQQSFELGKIDAKEEHKFLGWYFLGTGSAFAAIFVPAMLGVLLHQASAPDYDDPWVPALPFIGLAGGLSASFVPAFLSPKRETIFPYIGGVELECYRDGYKNKARWKNSGALLLGELTVMSGFVLFIFLLTRGFQ